MVPFSASPWPQSQRRRDRCICLSAGSGYVFGNPSPNACFCHARLHDIGKGDPDSDIGPEFLTADIHLYDEDGNRVGEVGGFGAKRSTRMRLFSAFEAVEGLLYEPVWRPIPPAGGVPTADFLLSPLAIAPDRTTETARTPSAKEQGTVEQDSCPVSEASRAFVTGRTQAQYAGNRRRADVCIEFYP